MIFMQLTDDQRKDVYRVSRHAVGRVALRAQMVLLSDRSFFGDLDARSDVFHWTDHDRKLATGTLWVFVAFLDDLVAAYPTGPVYVVLDNAPTHTAKVVQRWLVAHPRAQLLWLPKYAPMRSTQRSAFGD